MKHTKGPWTYSARIDEGFRIHTDTMADAIADIDEWQTKEETEANARLIAAAPELLEACKKLIEIAPKLWGIDIEKWPKITDRFNRVIMKAEGR